MRLIWYWSWYPPYVRLRCAIFGSKVSVLFLSPVEGSSSAGIGVGVGDTSASTSADARK